MKLISKTNGFSSQGYPILFYSGAAVMFVLALMYGIYAKDPMFPIVMGVMPILGYYSWRANVRDLADEVYDCGDFLLVKKQGEEDTVPLSHITNISFSTNGRNSMARITLTLDRPGKFGQKILFAPPSQFYIDPLPKNEIAENLIIRAAQARSKNAA